MLFRGVRMTSGTYRDSDRELMGWLSQLRHLAVFPRRIWHLDGVHCILVSSWVAAAVVMGGGGDVSYADAL